MKRPSSAPSHTITRITFGVIIVLVLAQVVWWTIFGYRYVGEVTGGTHTMYERDLRTANLVLERGADPELVRELEALYPHLSFDGQRFALEPAAVAAFREQQASHVRMFVFEGAFFLLVVLSGLWVIAQSLRAERELKRQQQNFLSAVTHEFRTPISTLRLLIESALYRSLSPERGRQYLERMQGELARLEATSEQVLASARLEQGGAAPTLESVDLNDVVREAIAAARAGLEARGAVLQVRYAPEPLPVSLDPQAFRMVLNNLLDNAVKYTPGERKPVRVALEPQGHLALLHVEDEGQGIDPAEAKRVFERFYRVGNELTRQSTGVGLGLHLVRSITEAMNGWVRCEAPADPDSGRGSRFTVVLPRRLERVAVGSAQEAVS